MKPIRYKKIVFGEILPPKKGVSYTIVNINYPHVSYIELYVN